MRILQWLVIIVPLAIGILFGLLVRAAVLLWAAFLQGYAIGRGHERT